MKRLMAIFTLLAASAFGQTTTGTVQTIGNWQYFTFTTPQTYYQPFTFQYQFNAFQPLQVPLIDTFQPARSSLYELGNVLAYKRALELQQKRLQLEAENQRIKNEILMRELELRKTQIEEETNAKKTNP